MVTYTIATIGYTRAFSGTLRGAVERAKRVDAEYQKIGGVAIELDGQTVATVDDGQIEYFVPEGADWPSR